eukprot:g69997.t1
MTLSTVSVISVSLFGCVKEVLDSNLLMVFNGVFRGCPWSECSHTWIAKARSEEMDFLWYQCTLCGAAATPNYFFKEVREVPRAIKRPSS